MNLRNGWQMVGGRLVRPSGVDCGSEEPITAIEIEESIGIPVASTEWFNKSGVVPAADVVREVHNRMGSFIAPPSPDRIRGVTRSARMTHKQFSECLGVTEDALAKWLSGSRTPPSYLELALQYIETMEQR